jgi:hypothetical protein
LKRRFYIVLVSRDEGGGLRKLPIPLHYAYVFVAAAVIGAFTITGLAGSYSRMLIKTARFNQLRNDRDSLQKDYAHLEKQAQEKGRAGRLAGLAGNRGVRALRPDRQQAGRTHGPHAVDALAQVRREGRRCFPDRRTRLQL